MFNIVFVQVDTQGVKPTAVLQLTKIKDCRNNLTKSAEIIPLVLVLRGKKGGLYAPSHACKALFRRHI